MKSLFFSLIAAMSSTAFAADPGSYACRAMVVAAELPNGSAETNYTAPANGGSHGGNPYVFTFQNHQISILSDGKWLAFVWTKDGKVIAKVTSVRDVPTRASVLIAVNPSNEAEHASVDCTAADTQ